MGSGRKWRWRVKRNVARVNLCRRILVLFFVLGVWECRLTAQRMKRIFLICARGRLWALSEKSCCLPIGRMSKFGPCRNAGATAARLACIRWGKRYYTNEHVRSAQAPQILWLSLSLQALCRATSLPHRGSGRRVLPSWCRVQDRAM
jgi:hypothetical protein